MFVALLIFSFISFVASNTRFEGTTVYAQVVLRCKNPRDPIAKVFLMESDLQDYIIDEDDTMDFSDYHFGETPEMKLTLRGQEIELSGIEPYIYVTHACTKESNTMKTYAVMLMERMYRSRSFDVIINLDTETSVVIPRLLY